MTAIDRRTLLRSILPGAAATAVVVTAGVTLLPPAAQAVPLASGKGDLPMPDSLIEDAQVVIVPPHRRRRRHWRRRRRWVCWWHRGRRVCGWRYW